MTRVFEQPEDDNLGLESSFEGGGLPSMDQLHGRVKQHQMGEASTSFDPNDQGHGQYQPPPQLPPQQQTPRTRARPQQHQPPPPPPPPNNGLPPRRAAPPAKIFSQVGSAVYHAAVAEHLWSGNLMVFIRRFRPDPSDHGGIYAGQVPTYAKLVTYVRDNFFQGQACEFVWTLQLDEEVVAQGNIPFAEDRLRMKQIEDYLGPSAPVVQPEYPELPQAIVPWQSQPQPQPQPQPQQPPYQPPQQQYQPPQQQYQAPQPQPQYQPQYQPQPPQYQGAPMLPPYQQPQYPTQGYQPQFNGFSGQMPPSMPRPAVGLPPAARPYVRAEPPPPPQYHQDEQHHLPPPPPPPPPPQQPPHDSSSDEVRALREELHRTRVEAGLEPPDPPDRFTQLVESLESRINDLQSQLGQVIAPPPDPQEQYPQYPNQNPNYPPGPQGYPQGYGHNGHQQPPPGMQHWQQQPPQGFQQ